MPGATASKVDVRSLKNRIRNLYTLRECQGAPHGEKVAAHRGIERILASLKDHGYNYTLEQIIPGATYFDPDAPEPKEEPKQARRGGYERYNRDGRTIMDSEKLDMVRRYNSGWTVNEIGRYHNVSHLWVARMLKDLGFKLKRGRRAAA